MRRALRTRTSLAGFTLIELMVTLTIAAVLATIAAPNMRDFIRNGRLTSEANDLLRSLQQARSEAIKRQTNVQVCFTANPTAATPTCSFSTGTAWIVFQDIDANWNHETTEPILATHVFDSSVTIISDHDALLSYASTGFPVLAGTKTPTENVVMCDSRGNQAVGSANSTARAVLISETGRARVTREKAKITEALTDIGTSLCP